MTTVVVSGAIANKPHNGGEAWVRLSWIRGLQRLGCRVYFVEQIDRAGFEQAAARDYFDAVMQEFGLGDSAALVVGDAESTLGLTSENVLDIAGEADLLVNISGNMRAPAISKRFKRRAYVDLDPGFTQFWHASGN